MNKTTFNLPRQPLFSPDSDSGKELDRLSDEATKVTDYVVVNGQLVPKHQATNTPNSQKIDMPEKPVYLPNENELDRLSNEATKVTDYVVVNGQLVPKTEVSNLPPAQKDQVIDMPKKPVYAWYDGQRGRALYAFEMQCLENFRKKYNNPAFNYKAQIRSDGKLEVIIALPFNPGTGWEIWKLQMLYDDNHPTRNREDTVFGGSIKVYPISPIPTGFHHLVGSGDNGRSFVCQTKQQDAEEVNAYAALENVIRWITVYYVWKRTGKDIDAGKS